MPIDDRIEQILRRLRQSGEAGDDAFNAIAEPLGYYMRRGRIYPAALGRSHTAHLSESVAA